MRIGYHSPMPPAASGVADYSAALVEHLRRHVTVEVNPRGDCDVEVYHLGNNPLHEEAYVRALARPGVVVIHDAVLNHFHLGRSSRHDYAEEFVYNYGEWYRDYAGRLWDRRAGSGQNPEYFAWPMLKRAVERARAVVVHNPAAARIAREHGAREVVEIPHLWEPGEPAPGREIEELRRSWGAGADGFVAGVFGHLRETKRLIPVLQVFERLRRADARLVLVVAGGWASRDLEAAVRPWLRAPGVVRAERLSKRALELYASAVDACINLRYPAAGETSGIAVRLMGLGKPVLVTAGEETARFPETAVVRVEAGVAEAESLAVSWKWLAGDRGAARRIGAEARAYIRRVHGAEAVIPRWLEAIAGAKLKGDVVSPLAGGVAG